MENDALIGRLYKALVEAEEQKKYLIDVIGAIKSKEIALERIETNGNSVTVLAESNSTELDVAIKEY